MAQQNAHRRNAGMGSVTGFVLALAMLAATAFVFMRAQPSQHGLVWADIPSDEAVITAAMD
jgi:hypothetical protein